MFLVFIAGIVCDFWLKEPELILVLQVIDDGNF